MSDVRQWRIPDGLAPAEWARLVWDDGRPEDEVLATLRPQAMAAFEAAAKPEGIVWSGPSVTVKMQAAGRRRYREILFSWTPAPALLCDLDEAKARRGKGLQHARIVADDSMLPGAVLKCQARYDLVKLKRPDLGPPEWRIDRREGSTAVVVSWIARPI